MHRKGAQDLKKAKLLTKASREIASAVREGGLDPQVNPRLRNALAKAREAGLSKERVEKALNPAEKEVGEEINYHACGPGGAALLIQCITDNKNRTASEVRSVLHQHGAKLENASHFFNRLGVITFSPEKLEQVVELLSEITVEETLVGEEVKLFLSPQHLSKARKRMALLEGIEYEICWRPNLTHSLASQDAEKLKALVADLEEEEDVQKVWTSF